jgi:hypothetical protein
MKKISHYSMWEHLAVATAADFKEILSVKVARIMTQHTKDFFSVLRF